MNMEISREKEEVIAYAKKKNVDEVPKEKNNNLDK